MKTHWKIPVVCFLFLLVLGLLLGSQAIVNADQYDEADQLVEAMAAYNEGVAAYNKGDYQRAIEKFQPLAEQGHAIAQYNFGLMYDDGQAVPQDYVQAYKWYTLSAARSKGDLRKKAVRYRNAIEKKMSPAQVAEAQKLAREWIPEGDRAASSYKEGDQAYESGDYKKAIEIWKPLAHRGYPPAQNDMGYMYSDGKGVPENRTKAIMWWRKAAEQGHINAQFNTGLYLSLDDDTNVESKKWFEMAAEQGDCRSQFFLAGIYKRGEKYNKGVPQNYVLAHKWYQLSCAGAAPSELVAIKKLMTPAQISEAQKLAREWKPKTWKELSQQN